MSLSASYNLLHEPWLPVRRRSGGTVVWIRPAEITAAPEDPVADFAWGRPDFDAASREFLIGLLATALAPESDDVFDAMWESPPDTVQLDRAFAPFAFGFNLDGDGPRFLQDLDVLEDAEASPVSALLIEAPGANTLKENKDLFQKRGRVPYLGLPAAAIALYTLQTYAPSGGAGHRTSLRGGGPLTTLVEPADPTATLWQKLWLNVPKRKWRKPEKALPLVFPWLAPTVTSDGKPPRQVSPENSHELQSFWGMPRRIRLDFAEDSKSPPCPLTGKPSPRMVASYRTRPYGVMYTAFEHWLSPYYKAKANDTSWLPVHPQPGGIAYRDWPKLASLGTSMARPASCVAIAVAGRLPSLPGFGSRHPRLAATGYDMDNMKARGFVEARMPIFLPKPEWQQQFYQAAANLVASAELVARLTASSVRHAFEGDHGDAKSTPYEGLRERFYAETENEFYGTLRQIEESAAFDGAAWLRILRGTALRLFDEKVPLENLPDKLIDRSVKARAGLTAALAGFGKVGGSFYTYLGLPPPESRPKSPKPARSTRKPSGDKK
ncbi:type I-E CRISPR-associated protein Cse1/CasA [Nordella sp. HKS 07]|uniref:type I-E CRISPR-associated protein Cse1/CasA n=1 Tax=Nordella sp. HKS 07 TaxID=2712222 RepID=UPI0013E204F4|nr:type I-E CRISPR-associated protein Cse1/CasA [Nordella sp. HKS 07]QIG50139.1 type I-E CRISPR-associated protein Cse1/CasA [Nordella sp. HKS 07]